MHGAESRQGHSFKKPPPSTFITLFSRVGDPEKEAYLLRNKTPVCNMDFE